MNHYRWILKLPERDKVLQLQKESGWPPLLSLLLVNRGICEAREALRFLYPRLSDFEDPFQLPDMKEGVKVLGEALRKGQKIGIYGDYDVDGVTGAAVLYLFLKELGAEPAVLFPHRERDGYGFHAHLLPWFKTQGVEVIVTVDCGISALEVVEEAKRLSLKVIVTDHHELPPTLPRAEAVISGKRTPPSSPFYHLCGAGVAFALVRALRSYLFETGFFKDQIPNLKRYLDLVALGTVADMVPLKGENRLLTFFGLPLLSERARPGIRALCEVSGINGTLGTEEILFRLGPRINAAGRLKEARLAFELLVTEEIGKARERAEILNRLNAERQRREPKVLAEALEQIPAKIPSGLVLFQEDWPLGILGIVASRLAERYYRPVVLLTRKGDLLKGSGRSIPEVDLYQALALAACAEDLAGFGGHPAAGGLKLEAPKLKRFAENFSRAIEAQLSRRKPPLRLEELQPQLHLEAQAEVRELLDPNFLEGFQRLAPFGPGNPEPVMAFSNFEVRNPKRVAERHLRFTLWQKGTGLSAIFFRLPEEKSALLLKTPDLHLAASPVLSHFQGRQYLELKIWDIKEGNGEGQPLYFPRV